MQPRNLDPEDPQVRTAVFGKEVEDFLATAVGDYLIKKAEKALGVALEQLKTVDAGTTLTIIRLQERIRLLESFEGWLGAAVEDGHMAIRALDGEGEVDG